MQYLLHVVYFIICCYTIQASDIGFGKKMSGLAVAFIPYPISIYLSVYAVSPSLLGIKRRLILPINLCNCQLNSF